jgi:hypothetical protein
MNEVDWLSGSDPSLMLDYLEGKTSDRKLRLLACAFVRRCWGHLRYHTGREVSDTPILHYPAREAVLVAERYAEGEASDGDLEAARLNAEMSYMNAPQFQMRAYMGAWETTNEQAMEAARQACDHILQQGIQDELYDVPAGPMEARARADALEAEGRGLCDAVRELFGNPFRPVKFDRNWLLYFGGAGEAMLQTVLQDNCFDELPYLADALTDAGCAEETILRHLRQPANTHFRGCWVIDALAGRQ